MCSLCAGGEGRHGCSHPRRPRASLSQHLCVNSWGKTLIHSALLICPTCSPPPLLPSIPGSRRKGNTTYYKGLRSEAHCYGRGVENSDWDFTQNRMELGGQLPKEMGLLFLEHGGKACWVDKKKKRQPKRYLHYYHLHYKHHHCYWKLLCSRHRAGPLLHSLCHNITYDTHPFIEEEADA